MNAVLVGLFFSWIFHSIWFLVLSIIIAILYADHSRKTDDTKHRMAYDRLQELVENLRNGG